MVRFQSAENLLALDRCRFEVLLPAVRCINECRLVFRKSV